LKDLRQIKSYDKIFEGFSQTISKFVIAGKKVVILVDNPALPNPVDCLDRKTSLYFMSKIIASKNEDCYIPLSEFNEQVLVYRKLLSHLSSIFPNSVEIVDATEVYCDELTGICGPTRNGRVLYSYTDHISDYAAGLVGAKINAHLSRK
jgi:hypothetical protein